MVGLTDLQADTSRYPRIRVAPREFTYEAPKERPLEPWKKKRW